MIRLLVTGASGMVGGYIKRVFDNAECILTDIDTLNICNRENVFNLVEEAKPDVILHLAAATDVDKCELNPDWAFQTNTAGTENIVLASKESKATLVFLSSGAVFDGMKSTPYTELDDVNPANIYGKTKLEAEKVVQSALKHYFIIRAGWMIGGGKKDVKFVGKIIRKMMHSESVNVVNDKFGSLTYAKDLLSGIKVLLTTDKFGLYHMVNQGMVSRFDIALEIKNILSPKKVKILPVSSESFPLPAPRGRSEALENFRLNQSGLYQMRDWKEALKDYLLNDYAVLE